MRRVIVSLLFIGVLLGAGAGVLKGLAGLKKPPEKKTHKLKALAVEAVKVVPEDREARLSGYGTVRARDRLSVSALVGGEVVEISPRLEVGESVGLNEVLFRIDERPYQYRLDQAKAEGVRLDKAASRLRRAWEGDKARLVLLMRMKVLAVKEHERAQALFRDNKVGTQSAVEGAERAVLAVREQILRLKTALAAYPDQEAELDAQKSAARSRVDAASLDLSRCVIRALFPGRVEKVNLEKGQAVSPGFELVRLVDDRVLELPVSLDGRDLALWIPFVREEGKSGWFGRPQAGPVAVSWVDAPQSHRFTGKFVRVEKFSPQSRTATAVVEISGQGAATGPALVEGMFCRAEFAGRSTPGVFRIPRSAVEHDGTVYFARDNRLARGKVEVLRYEEDFAVIRKGLTAGELLVISRLLSPAEGTPLAVTIVSAED